MSERKRTPDLLGIVMSGNDTKENKTPKQENLKQEELESNIAVKQVTHKEIQQESNIDTQPRNEDLKEKATFNLSKQALSELEDEWINIRRSFGGNKRITRTLIVEVALEMALEDFKNLEQNGKLYSKLANHKALKQ
jgi:hypothetical protein